MTTAVQALKSAGGKTGAENLLWSLFNKVDFVFNY
jgi:hypothetical protein